MNLKIDNSVLQAGALLFCGVLGIGALIMGQWGLAASALTGLFAVLSIHPKPPADPAPPTTPQP